MEQELNSIAKLLDEADATRNKEGWTAEDEAQYQGLIARFEELTAEIEGGTVSDVVETVTDTAVDIFESASPGLTEDGEVPGLSPAVEAFVEWMNSASIEDIPDALETPVAAAAGFVDGLSLGLVGYLIGKLAPGNIADIWEDLREENPGATTVGEIASIFTPAFTGKFFKWLTVGSFKTGLGIGKAAYRFSKNTKDAKFLAKLKDASSAGGKGATFTASELRNISKNVSKALRSDPSKLQKLFNAGFKAAQGATGTIATAAKGLEATAGGSAIRKMIIGATAATGATALTAFGSFVIAYRLQLKQGVSEEDARAIALEVAAISTGVSLAGRGAKMLGLFKKLSTGTGVAKSAARFGISFIAKLTAYNYVFDTDLNRDIREGVVSAGDLVTTGLEGAGSLAQTGIDAFNKGRDDVSRNNSGGLISGDIRNGSRKPTQREQMKAKQLKQMFDAGKISKAVYQKQLKKCK